MSLPPRPPTPTPCTTPTRGPCRVFVINNFANPLQLICAAIGAIENVTAAETAKLCAEYLGPALRQVNPLTF